MSDVQSTRKAMLGLKLKLEEETEKLGSVIDALSGPGEHPRDQYFAARFAARCTFPDLLERIIYEVNVQQCIEDPTVVTLAVTNMVEEIDKKERAKKKRS